MTSILGLMHSIVRAKRQREDAERIHGWENFQGWELLRAWWLRGRPR